MVIGALCGVPIYICYTQCMISRFIPHISANAHCDIPCGIYDPTPAKIAAKTMVRMLEQVDALEKPDWADKHMVGHYLQSVTRRVATKDEHAEKCKQELYVLWSDFFKPEHLKDFPDLHDRFWKAIKLCSKVRQDGDTESAKQLLDAVDGIAHMFYSAKSDPARYDAYKQITDKLY